jgi:hypothetical protein
LAVGHLKTNLTLTFAIIFVAVIALGAATIPVGRRLFRVSQWLETKLRNKALAFILPPLVFVVLATAAMMTAVISLNHKGICSHSFDITGGGKRHGCGRVGDLRAARA